ncbi:MAG: hypothetical protein AAFP85_16555 [Pseudomonadota bacterium]
MSGTKKVITLTIAGIILSSCGNAAMDIDASTERSSSPVVQALITNFTESCLDNAPSYIEADVKADFDAAPPTGQMTLLSFAPDRECSVFASQHTPANGAPTNGDLIAMAQVVQSRIGGSIIAPRRGTIAVEGGTADVSIRAGQGSDRGLRFSIRN